MTRFLRGLAEWVLFCGVLLPVVAASLVLLYILAASAADGKGDRPGSWASR